MELTDRNGDIIIDKTTGHRWRIQRFDYDINKWDLIQVDNNGYGIFKKDNDEEFVTSHISEELIKEGLIKGIYVLINDFKGNSPVKPNHYYYRNKSCTEVMKAFASQEEWISFCELNAIKYLYRYKEKNGKEDLEKAKEYINMILEYYDENIQK